MVVNDDDFCASADKAIELKEMARKVAQCCTEDNGSATTFGKWLHATLQFIVTQCQKKKVVDREKLWTDFHTVRSAQEFLEKWEEFLVKCDVPQEPVLYQHLSLIMFKSLISAALPVLTESTSSVNVLTHEELSAIRYMGGYVIRSLRSDGIESDLKFLVKEGSEGEEDWVHKLDRGGLIHITEQFYQVLCAIEYVIRQQPGPFDKEKIQDAILNDSDMLFNWCLASPFKAEDDEHITSIVAITKKWITIRGFSFARSVLEKYKQENKKGTAKSKPLRKKVSQAEQ